MKHPVTYLSHLLVVSALAGCTAHQGARSMPAIQAAPNDSALQQFDLLKTLEGNWTLVQNKDGKRIETPQSYAVTAGGSSLLETCFEGLDHEMLTLFNLDGEQLVLRHYCAVGNQPFMVADSGGIAPGAGDESRIIFRCIGGGNMKSCNEPHMHRAEYIFEANGEVSSEWTFYQDGKGGEPERFSYLRR